MILTAFITFISLATSSSYMLELSWKMDPPSPQNIIGYVTWNQRTLINLSNIRMLQIQNKQRINITFHDGPNILGIYFIGLTSNLIIDDIHLTKDGKSINYILNGNFDLSSFSQQYKIFLDKIPGWNAPKIILQKSKIKGNQLVLNSKVRTISQTISFGKVSNYQFIDTINVAIQNQARNIISANLESITANGVNFQDIWNVNSKEKKIKHHKNHLMGK